MSKPIPLSSDHVAIVDDHDYPAVCHAQWFRNGDGYAVAFVQVQGRFKLTYLHRYLLHAPDDQQVDHIDGNPLNNVRSNLRLVTPQQNSQNKRLSPLSATGLKGVGWHKRRQKYHVRIQQQGIRYHLGFFECPEEAALAYDAAARTLFGEFAVCNYPDEQTPQSVAFLVAQQLNGQTVSPMKEVEAVDPVYEVVDAEAGDTRP